MRRRQAVYGLDIETDTTENGLDPRVAAVVTVALAGPGYEEVFTGPEPELLVDLDERLAELEPGVLATWNGAAFDLPVPRRPRRAPRPAARAAPAARPRRSRCDARRCPGHRGAYRASWYDHGHLDAYRLYRGDVGPALRISCSLKSIARFVGLVPVEVDRTRSTTSRTRRSTPTPPATPAWPASSPSAAGAPPPGSSTASRPRMPSRPPCCPAAACTPIPA